MLHAIAKHGETMIALDGNERADLWLLALRFHVSLVEVLKGDSLRVKGEAEQRSSD